MLNPGHNRYGRLVLRFRWLIVLLGTLLAGVGSYYTALLYRGLQPNFEELLPTSAKSVLDMDQVRERLKAIDNIAVLVLSAHPSLSRRFVDDLARKLQAGPSELIASVEYKIDRELEFFRKRQALYLDMRDLEQVREYIQARMQYEKDIYNPLNIFSGENIPEPIFNLNPLRKKYDSKVSSYTRFPDGYYATPDGSKRVILVYKAGRSTDQLQSLKQLKKFVEQSVSELNPRSYAPDLEIRYTGNVENMLEEQAAILADLKVSAIVVTILVIAALLAYYRSLRATLALVLSLGMGTIWTFGLAYFLVGKLNANSAFMGSIVIGNGINFGIILTARYIEERKSGRLRGSSVLVAGHATYGPTLTAALAAGLSYGALTLTGFRGFRQFGVIGLVGMILCWASAYTVLPALLYIFGDQAARRGRKARGQGFFGALVDRGARHPGRVLAVSAVLTVLALIAFRQISEDVIEGDLTKIRSRESLARGSGHYEAFVDQIFQRYLSPVAILPRTRGEADLIAERIRVLQKSDPVVGPLIASVQTVDDFLPKDQLSKVGLLWEIRNLLSPRVMRELSPRDRKLVTDFLTPESLRPIRLDDLPLLIRNKFQEKDGTIGNLVLVEPPIGNLIRKRENLYRFVEALRKAADSVAPNSAVAGTLPVTADMLGSVSHDGPRATLYAFLAVVFLVIALFRRISTVAAVLSTLFLGVVWLVGLVLGIGLKVNFVNFIAFPITFGIGVDYGVNIFQRYLQEGRGSIVRVVTHTGTAVGLCSLTTIIGYGSLLISRNMAFFSFGLVAAFGEICCISAALFTVPAMIHLRDRRVSGLRARVGPLQDTQVDEKTAA